MTRSGLSFVLWAPILAISFFSFASIEPSEKATYTETKISALLSERMETSENAYFDVSIVLKGIGRAHSKSSVTDFSDLKTHNKFVKSKKQSVVSFLKQRRVAITKDFKSLSTLFIRADRETLLALSQLPEVAQIGLDSGGSGQMGEVHIQTKVDQVRQKYNLMGNNVEIAVLDSGIDTEHPDLADRILTQTCLADICANGANDATDDHGHGTHVAGILASNGTIAQEGIAPSAGLHIVKVLDKNNNFSSMATIAEGLDYVINELPNVSIVNMSLGSSARFNGHCDGRESWIAPLVEAIEILRERGVMVFVSSGNDGDTSGMQAPACISQVVSVSAVYDLDPSTRTYYCTDQNASANKAACFANYSYTTDIFAPGTPVRSSWPHRQSIELDGTSMAAPAVAGCGALLRSIYPDAEVSKLEALLKGTQSNSLEVEGGLRFPILNCMEVIETSLEQLKPSPIIELVTATTKVLKGTNVHAEMRAFDALDGVLDSNITWESQSEELHVGRVLRLVLPEGSHNIVASVQNDSGKKAAFEMNFEVFADDAPELSIVSPNENQAYLEQSEVTLLAVANDEFDGQLGDDIEWYLNNQRIAEGSNVRYAFEKGTHTLVAKVKDSHNNLTEVDVVITVSVPQAADPDKTSGGADWAALLVGLIALFRRRSILGRPRCFLFFKTFVKSVHIKLGAQ